MGHTGAGRSTRSVRACSTPSAAGDNIKTIRTAGYNVRGRSALACLTTSSCPAMLKLGGRAMTLYLRTPSHTHTSHAVTRSHTHTFSNTRGEKHKRVYEFKHHNVSTITRERELNQQRTYLPARIQSSHPTIEFSA